MKNYFSILVVSVFSILLFSCSSDNTAKVTIKTGLSPEKDAVQSSIPDRVLSMFSTALFASAPPSNIQSMSLSISGPGMEDTFRTFAPVSEITIDIPSGENRTFTLSAGTPSATIRGTTTANLKSGESKTISINMLIYESKIIIPDLKRNRIIQMDDMNGSNWVELDYSSFTSIGLSSQFDFMPYDITFDNRGRIYIVNNNALSGKDIIIRINDFTNPQPVAFANASANAPFAITFDRINDIIYFASASTVYRKETSSTAPASTFSTPGITIRGLTVGEDGYIYAARNTEITRIDPSTGAATTFISGLNTVWDVLSRDQHLYVANQSAVAAVSNKIIKFSLDGTNTGEFHSPIGSSDELKGPRRFLAVYNRSFYLIDHLDSNVPKWLTSFDDITGSGWDTFYPSEIGKTDFYFYYFC